MRPLPFLVLVALVAGAGRLFAVAAPRAPVLAVKPLMVGGARQVFVDGRFLTEASGISLVVHPPRKVGGMVLRPDHPRHTIIDQYASVVYFHGLYRLWYEAATAIGGDFAANGTSNPTAPFPVRKYLCYAYSTDGIHWVKPALLLARAEPYDEPNIVMGEGAGGYPASIADAGSVVVNPEAPASARLLLTMRRKLGRQGQLDLYTSSDGIHWRLTYPRAMTYATKKHQLDSQNVIFWDNRIDRYVAYVRRGVTQIEGRARVRTIARAQSRTLKHFPNVEDCPVVFQWDSLDPQWTLPDGRQFSMVDYYTNATVKYPWAADAYYMFPSAYFHYDRAYLHEFAKAAPVNAGVLDVRFAASRDGIHWHRYRRGPFVRLGFDGTWNSKALYMARGIVPGRRPDELYMYYRGSDQPHGWDRNPRNVHLLRAAGLGSAHNASGIGRLVLRRDGFISARAAYAGGQFTTPPLIFRGGQLVLNVNTSAAGEVRVELEDALGRPIPGFTLADADVIFSTNEINHVVTWNGRSDVASLAGRPVRLHFVIRDADLYAFQFRPAGS